MGDQDIRSLITSRQRKKVPLRDTTLVAARADEQVIQTTSTPSTEILETIESVSFLKTGKRLAITLEENVRSSLLSICDRAEVTPETFIEAAVILLEKESDLLQEICHVASQRLSERKKAGVKKRSQTMMQKYGLD
jgi:hypothetical protein